MRLASLFVLLAANVIAVPAFSNPLNPTVVNGSANFSQSGNVLTVTNSNGAIINWNKFSIAAGETTRFNQPSASSSVLNRVMSDPTTIYGTLSSNGQVFLINPGGIIVGPTGSINAPGIFLSTANIADADFLAGTLRFAAPPAAVPIAVSGGLTASDLIDIRASSFDCPGVCMLNAPNINFDSGSPPAPLIDLGNLRLIGEPSAGGSLILLAGSSSGNLSLSGGMSLGATGPMPPPAPNTPPVTSGGTLSARGNINLNVSLVDGAVTVRLPLVDVSPIVLR